MTSIGFEAMTGLMPYGPVGNCTIRDFVYLYITKHVYGTCFVVPYVALC